MVIKKSFYDWCMENNRMDLIDRWDIYRNRISPKEVGFSSTQYYYFKCPEGIHESSQYKLNNITRKNAEAVKVQCVYCNSFANYCIQNIDEHFLDKYWDYENNEGIDPWTIARGAHQEIYIKCQEKEYHGSYKTTPNHFITGCRCPYCGSRIIHPQDSFGQWCIDNVDPDFMEKYWGKSNTVDPFAIPKYYAKKVYLNCQDVEYHGEYLMTPSDFMKGCRCVYCGSGKTHILDSLGVAYPEVVDLWSEKNKKTPYEYSVGSRQKIWLKCNNSIHDDYEIKVGRAVDRLFECSQCRAMNQISHLQRKIDYYIEHNYSSYTYNHEYGCTIVPRNPKTNRLLPFDRELIINDDYHLIIECHGLQHYEICLFTKLSAEKIHITPEEQLADQQWRDEYKKQYALSHGYYYLEIPYYTEKDDSYKQLIDDKINSILTIQNDCSAKEVISDGQFK